MRGGYADRRGVARGRCAGEPVLQRARARPVAHAADEATDEQRARLVVRPGEMHRDRAAERPFDRRCRIMRRDTNQYRANLGSARLSLTLPPTRGPPSPPPGEGPGEAALVPTPRQRDER